jgi:hypothetical protein
VKQSQVKSGDSYLFYRTDVEHRKSMEGTIVTISGSKIGGKKENYHSGILFTGVGRKPKRFKLTNGQWCNAGELKTIPNLSASREVR